MFGEFEFEPTNFCGHQWRDIKTGEHMCFEPLNHPNGSHFSECGLTPTAILNERFGDTA